MRSFLLSIRNAAYRRDGLFRKRRVMSQLANKYDALGGFYDFLTAYLEARPIRALREGIVSRADGHTLDAGCGTGRNLLYVPKDADVVGADLSRKALAVAETRAKRLGVPFLPMTADLAHLPSTEAQFDSIVCTFVGCTLDDPRAVYREFARVIRRSSEGAASGKGGLLMLEHVRVDNSTAFRVFSKVIAPLSRRLLHCDPNRNTMQMVEEAGFRITDTQAFLGGMFVGFRAVPI